MQDSVVTGIAIGCIAAGAIGVYLAMRAGAGAASVSHQLDPSDPPLCASSPRPANQLAILTGAELLERTGAAGLLEQIRSRMGLTPSNWERDVLGLVHNFAEFVQLLPASESHHHAQPGGLLVHSMECAAGAISLRQGYKLPLGAAPEDQIRLGSVWTYGVLVAALLHDVGKPIADVVVDLFGEEASQPLTRWSGLAGSMRASQASIQASHYKVTFPDQRDYSAHSRLPITLLHALVPASALQWLSTDPGLMTELLTYLDGSDQQRAGTRPGALREMVTKADMQSVADNLKAGVRTRFAAARNLPLIERLMQGLRALFAEGHVALNRPGAAAFVDPDGIHIWVVAGVAADQTRKLLELREEKQAGAAGLPADNTRLFDTWAEYGVLVQPPKEFGKGSVWWVHIELDGWSQVLTVLKFPVDKIYAPGTPRPAVLNGTVTPVEPTSKADRSSDSPTPTLGTTVSGVILDDQRLEVDGMVPDALPCETGATPSEDWRSLLTTPTLIPGTAIQLPTGSEAAPPIESQFSPAAAPVNEFLDDAETATAIRTPPALQAPGKAVQAATKPPRPLYRLPNSKPRENADRFMAWIQHGLGTGDLNYNESDAVIHFVDGGMALVSPKVFRMYLESNEFVGDTGTSKDALRALQQDVQKGGYIARNTDDKSSFHYFQVQRANEEAGAVINCYLIPNPQAYIRPVPSPNPLLQRCQKPEKGAA